MTNLPTTSRGSHRPTTGAVSTGGQTLTVSQALQYFALSLKRPNNYLRIVRRYLEYCIEHRSTIDPVSSSLYTAGQRPSGMPPSGMPPSMISPVRKFVRFAAEHQIVRVVADPEQSTVPPAANELILGYLSEANLRGESKITYTKSLNAFFAYLDTEQSSGGLANFSHTTVRKYLEGMKKQQISPFTVQVRLSAIKGLSRWVVDHHDRLPVVLDRDQLERLAGH